MIRKCELKLMSTVKAKFLWSIEQERYLQCWRDHKTTCDDSCVAFQKDGNLGTVTCMALPWDQNRVIATIEKDKK